jgi:hypothetical protein
MKMVRCTNTLLLLLIACITVFPENLFSQGYGRAPSVQELTGKLGPNEYILYKIPRLIAGDTLYVYAAGTSQNMDPLIGLFPQSTDFKSLQMSFQSEVDAALSDGRDLLQVVPEFADKNFLAWNDDLEGSYAAGFEYAVQRTGAYQLLVCSTRAKPTFGEFRLLLGVNEPKILSGEAQVRGNALAMEASIDLSEIASIEERIAEISPLTGETVFDLRDFKAGDTIYALVEARSEGLKPVLLLEDFGEKPIRSSNSGGKSSNASFEYTFARSARSHRIRIKPATSDLGEFRLVVGLNAPEVLSGDAPIQGGKVFADPVEVSVGVRLQQIAGVNQKAKNFSVIASIAMTWLDPDLAFSPESCQCQFKTYRGDSFNTFVSGTGATWPDFVIANQSSNRFTQNRSVVVRPNGEVLFFERFTTTLQASDFDFRRFPFDVQKFPIHIDLVFPERFYVFKPHEGFSGTAAQLGEEEWLVTGFNTLVGSQTENLGVATSRFTFLVKAGRRINYYVFRLFLPIFVILSVSWVTVLMKDYDKRVDVSNANLLLFMAFSFTIANDLPRLGYLTFLDTVLIGAFLATSVVVILNIYVRKMHLAGKKEFVERMDRHLVWGYPAFYVFTVIVVTVFFG